MCWAAWAGEEEAPDRGEEGMGGDGRGGDGRPQLLCPGGTQHTEPAPLSQPAPGGSPDLGGVNHFLFCWWL